MQAKLEIELQILLRRAVKGDSLAYKEFLTIASRIIKRILGSKIFNLSDVDDVTQEILISIHKAKHTYDFSRPLMPWIYSIINFRVADHLRKEYGEKIFDKVEIDEAMKFEDSWGVDENSVTDSAARTEYIEKAILKLKDKQRTIIKLMYFEDLSVKEVAAKLMISESDVKVSAHRAYKVLRSSL